jgi:hypothetical protein
VSDDSEPRADDIRAHPKENSVTKAERAKRLQTILVDLLAPLPGRGRLHVEVQAISKNCLLVEALRRGSDDEVPSPDQVYVRFQVLRPNAVKEIHDALLGPDEELVESANGAHTEPTHSFENNHEARC